MHTTPIDPAGLTAMDPAEAGRVLKGVREAVLGGRRSALGPRAEIGESWQRLMRAGLDPERGGRAGLLPREEIERRRGESPLRTVLPVLREGLVGVADAAQHVVTVADADGKLLWREGTTAVLRKGDAHGFVVGSDWSEPLAGTTAIGTVLVARRPVLVHAAEHFVAAYHSWTCAGAPVADPRNGRLIGVVNVCGPLGTAHPTILPLVTAVTRLAEAQLRLAHLTALEKLRAVAAPLLGRMTGRAVVTDGNGWPAAVIGMPPPQGRLQLPRPPAAGRYWIAPFGTADLEPVPGGWLIRITEPGGPGPVARVVVDLTRLPRASATVHGAAGSWVQELSPRHAQLLGRLAAHREGRSAAELAADLFGDPTRTVTVRAEMSRLRRQLPQVLMSRPYRFAESIEVEVRHA
ncbi:GAF domain-containing protein [Streptomyces qinzhouensis]|uniref:GAF domain-containing protein n=1 Tax=Streptomyces qinzhouensis TaxID=2599401 RepID=A0A5B8JL80_9ACTN|nr:GAF domain-containing protein [Streptomyces qinzhouensis]